MFTDIFKTILLTVGLLINEKNDFHCQLFCKQYLTNYSFANYVNSYLQKTSMMEIKDDEDTCKIEIKRPFIPKFFKELNNQEVEKLKKSTRKQKGSSAQSTKKIQIFDQLLKIMDTNDVGKPIEVNRNGNRIIGIWKNDKLHGDVQIYYHNGVTFKGFYQNGIKVRGHFTFLNGYQYKGNCLGSKFNGEGSLFFPSGKVISGNWKDYNIIGKGKIAYPNGEVYYGQISNFKKNGKGYLFFSDGTKYSGQFQNGLITGNGKYYINDKLVSSGSWMNGQLIKSVDFDQQNDQSIKQQSMHSKQQITTQDISKPNNREIFLTKIQPKMDDEQTLQILQVDFNSNHRKAAKVRFA